MMRVTQSLLYRSSTVGLQRQFQELRRAQEQTLSGREVNRPSDSPSAMFRDMVFGSEASAVRGLQRTTDYAAQRMTLAETHLQGVHDKFLEVQDLAMTFSSSQNAGMPQITSAVSNQILSMYQDILQAANSELDGVPLFGGGRSCVPFSSDKVMTTAVQMRSAGKGSLVSSPVACSAQANVEGKTVEVPKSVRVVYHAGSIGEPAWFESDINGQKPPVRHDATMDGENFTIQLGDGVTFTIATDASGLRDQDSFFFDVVPEYQGGDLDRQVRVSSGEVLAGNITGADLIEGRSPLGRGMNLFGVLSGLRGAMLRDDHEEIGVRLNQIQECRAQVSDLQAIMGIRASQMETIRDALDSDLLVLETSKADNIDADAFEVMSRLEQASQAMQFMTASERKVLDNSLLDFLG
jgi:flagellar hook-associated protein 3 FlgL